MKPVNHIFLFRSNIDIHNEKVNQRLLNGLTSAFKHQITLDQNGQAVIDKSKPIKQRTINQQHGATVLSEENTYQACEEKRNKVIPAETSSQSTPGYESLESHDDYTDVAVSPLASENEVAAEEAKDDTSNTSTNRAGSTKKSMSRTRKNNLVSGNVPYWIEELGLKVTDKLILEGGYWLNDRIINAAMTLLRNETYERDIGGLQDLAVAQQKGFLHSDNGEGFVQIINLRGNHWVTVSNMLCALSETCVYDSLQALNVDTKQKKIRYPISVEQVACQLSRPYGSLDMLVENVQQQRRGEDCGLFAIAYAALLCLKEYPAKALFDQDDMRHELIRSFERMDIAHYLNSVVTIEEDKEPEVLYRWTCEVYCSCRMPDDGNEMIECRKCKCWYHQECVQSECSKDWLCPNCEFGTRKKSGQEAVKRPRIEDSEHEDKAGEEKIAKRKAKDVSSCATSSDISSGCEDGQDSFSYTTFPKTDTPQESNSTVVPNMKGQPQMSRKTQAQYTPTKGVGPAEALTKDKKERVEKKSKGNATGTREHPIDVSKVKERPLSTEDRPWIGNLELTVKELRILQSKAWVNDSIINAAMGLLRKSADANGIGGLEDVVIARDKGFSNSDSGLGFIQIVNVRDNHWITVSNVLCAPSETCVYDSLQALNVKTNESRISYPINVEQAACKLSKRKHSFSMIVENVQQQTSVDDCGLFAIAHATLLCKKQDPARAVLNQGIMRKELIKSLEKMDMARFLKNVVTMDGHKKPIILYRWTCKVYCHCCMPDDGREMVQCSGCKSWNHAECVRDYSSQEIWLCRNCAHTERQYKAAMSTGYDVRKMPPITSKYPIESKKVQDLYAAIAATHGEYKFLEADSHIGYMTKDDWLEFANIKRDKDALGRTCTKGVGHDYDYFVMIYPGAFQSDKCLLCTVIHEMAHAKVGASERTFHADHGPEFKKAARSIINSVKGNPSALPAPFSSVTLDQRFILTATTNLSE